MKEILILSKNNLYNKALASTFEPSKNRYALTFVSNTAHLLLALSKGSPQIIVVDLNVILENQQLVASIRKNGVTASILVLTVFNEDLSVENLSCLHVDGVFSMSQSIESLSNLSKLVKYAA